MRDLKTEIFEIKYLYKYGIKIKEASDGTMDDMTVLTAMTFDCLKIHLYLYIAKVSI